MTAKKPVIYSAGYARIAGKVKKELETIEKQREFFITACRIETGKLSACRRLEILNSWAILLGGGR